MAANKFATMLQRNTNKMVVILVYALLEWILILLLLLNSLFSYFITKFAKWVGLKPPCIWCSRVDHVLQQGDRTSLHKDLVCETHAAEISNLGYCSNHHKLTKTQSMCEDCLASRPNHHENINSFGMRHRIASLSWMNHENGENVNKCSCCNESLSLRSNQNYPPYWPMKPSWDDENYPSKGSLIVESIEDEIEDDKDKEFERKSEEDHDDDERLVLVIADEHSSSDIESFILREVGEDHSSSVSNLHSDEKDAEKYEKEDDHYLTITELDPSGDDDFINQFVVTPIMLEDRSLEVINMHFENYVDCDTNRLIPVKFIDSITSFNFQSCKLNENKIQNFSTDSPVEAQSSVLEGEVLHKMDENAEKTSLMELESFENSVTSEDEGLQKNSVVEVHPQRINTEEAQISVNDVDNSVEEATKELEEDKAQVDLPQSQEPICSDECTQDDESESSDDESDDGSEVPNAFEKFIAQNNLSMSHSLSNDDKSSEADMEEPEADEEPICSSQCIPENESSTSEDDTEASNAFDEFIFQNNLCPDKTGENDNEYAEMVDKISVEKVEEETSHQSSKCSESREVEEDKLPETPSSADGLHYLHRKLMFFEKRESRAEDPSDGSVASEAESSDPVLTIDRLKTTLKTEQRALTAIYQELEEERSASAVAANQTMAMITRLQEEKAAMQMEALQYQRMMEEQAEYDQEALQLLNDLMMKREKEKQELEKELEEYRQKVMEYEAKEKLRVLRIMKDGNGSIRSRGSTCSCCNTGYTDDLSIDLNHESREQDDNDLFDIDESSKNNASIDTVSNLEEIALGCVKHVTTLDSTLEEFEEEKASILDQLKALEEKIICLEENEEFLDDKDLNEKCGFTSLEEYSNGFSEDKHSPPVRTTGCLAKKLLPYLDDAADEENDGTYRFERQLENESIDVENSVPIREIDSMKVSIEEEVDRVYERLQALETDREFLHHCMGNIQNGGDKGTDLLQEILQHLRDLKDVELRMKNLDNNPL